MSDAPWSAGFLTGGVEVSKTAFPVAAVLLLTFTGSTSAVADTPHVTDGPAATVGSIVGYSEFRGEEVTAIGGYLSIAHRFGRFTVATQLEMMRLQERGVSDPSLELRGTMSRLGLVGRLDVLRVTNSDWVGDNSMVILWVEGGLGRQRAEWSGNGFARTDTSVGAGWLLDHRFKKPLGFPSRVGWHFGWRLSTADAADHKPSVLAACKNSRCPAPSGSPPRDVAMLVTSGLTFTW